MGIRNNPSQDQHETLDPRDPQQRRARIEAHIEQLRRTSRKGLWGILIFAVISVLAVSVQDIDPLQHLSPQVRQLLGKPPSPDLINIALAVYSFSALILTLSRLADRAETYKGWSHLGYLTGFYLFYFLSHALQVNAWAVIIAGFTILGLEYYSLYSYTQEAIAREKEILQRLQHLNQDSAGSDNDDRGAGS